MITRRELYRKLLKILKMNSSSYIEYVFRRILFSFRSWIFDELYYPVSLDALLDALDYWRTEVLPGLVYTPEVMDCDDFAIQFINFIRRYLYNNYNEETNSIGIALGVIYKSNELLGGHAWNIILVNNSVYFIEPQLGEILLNLKSSDGFKYKLLAVII